MTDHKPPVTRTVNGRLLLAASLLILGGCAAGPSSDRAARPDPAPESEAIDKTPAHPASQVPTARITIADSVQHRISPLLFGQFLEDAGHPDGGGEPGPAAGLIPGTDELRPDVLHALADLHAPIIRFPGGYMAERHDDRFDYRAWLPGPIPGWNDPPLNQAVRRDFDLIAFYDLVDQLDAEPLVVLPTRPAFQGDWTIDRAAAFAAGLVAMANAEHPDDVPDRYRPWVRARIDAGRPTPADVKYWQLGNEIWIFRKEVSEDRGWTERQWFDFQLQLINAMSRAMRDIDPDITLITDGMTADYNQRLAQLDPGVDMLSEHKYVPWKTEHPQRDGQPLPVHALSPRDHWRALIAAPAIDAHGRSVWPLGHGNDAHDLPLAFTEWNWNGWDQAVNGHPVNHAEWGQALGAAGFLHAIMRRADRAALATQSMMLGAKWDITAVRVEPGFDAFVKPTGRVTAFYRRHHGHEMLQLDDARVPRSPQPYRLGGIKPADQLARIDAIATRDDQRIYLHMIHRGYHRPTDLTVDLAALDLPPGQDAATLRLLVGRTDLDLGDPRLAHLLREVTLPVDINNGVARLRLPPATIAVLEIPRHPH